MVLRFLMVLMGSFLIINNINAQLCQGSLGDPIINITFGQGSNPGAPLSAATTSYQYVASDCPPDGYYTVRNNTSGCFGNTWHALGSDHTGDLSGYFMLVNASFQPGEFYKDTVKGLCGNTTYEFATWLINVVLPTSCNGSSIQPNLTFIIEKTDGTLLQSSTTNNIPASSTPSWTQYGFFFTTPPSVSDIVLRIVNNAPGGCGNDLALDDITFRACGPQIGSTLDGQPVTSVALCEGSQQTFALNCTTSGGFSNPAFQWQSRNPNTNIWSDIPTANNPTFVVTFTPNTPPGFYQFRLAIAESGNLNSSQCTVYSQPFSFTISPNPVTTVSNTGPVCEGSVITLTATGGSQHQWSGPNGFTSNGSPLQFGNIQLSQAGKYFVTVTNSASCTRKDSTIVIVNPLPLASTIFATANNCSGDSIQLTAGGGLTYKWIPSSGLSANNIYNPKASPAQTTNYMVVVSNQFSCEDTAVIRVINIPKPIADAGPDTIIFKGQSIKLSGKINTLGNFVWLPAVNIDDIYSLNPIVNPPADRKYILNFVSGFGCGVSSDTVSIKVVGEIFIPGAFSPNGDNVNDFWNIPSLGACPVFEVSVYNRFGQLVFQTKNKRNAWDGMFQGKPLPIGVYVYLIKTCNYSGVIKGTVLLFR